MEGPHTNVGTWAPGYLATLLRQYWGWGRISWLQCN